MEDNRLTQTMLLDFYGDLLTDKQRECYELHCNEDLSLSEIAEQCGISRQGVWDNIRRAEASLMQIEEKTGLIGRYLASKDTIDSIIDYSEKALTSSEDSDKEAFSAILKMLYDLKGKV